MKVDMRKPHEGIARSPSRVGPARFSERWPTIARRMVVMITLVRRELPLFIEETACRISSATAATGFGLRIADFGDGPVAQTWKAGSLTAASSDSWNVWPLLITT